MSKNYILTAEVANKKLRRMAYEILENNADEPGLILAGVRESGSVIARCIHKILGEISSLPAELITISLDKKMPA
jgi:pyrimidine operon attenuation protein / uracil phosphoribosyltransferase